MDSHCSVESNWQWTRYLCQQSRATEFLGGAKIRGGVALASARRKKARTCPELVAAGARARLVVLALEVGGRWSQEASTFVKLLAKAKVGARCGATPNGAGVEAPVEFDPGVRCCTRLCRLWMARCLIRTRLSAIFTMRACVGECFW